MFKKIYSFLILIGIAGLAYGGLVYNPMLSNNMDMIQTIQEEDGSPVVPAATIIKVPNTSLTDNADGSVSLDFGVSGGAPTDADYLVGTANGTLSAEIVVGTTPGGSLGNTWASPTIDDLFIKLVGDTTGALTEDLNIDANTLVVDYDTNEVGIGVADPLAKLHVYSSSGNVIFQHEAEGGANDLDIKFGYNNYGWYWRYLGSGSGDNNQLQLWSEGAGSTDMQVYGIMQSGNITFKKMFGLNTGTTVNDIDITAVNSDNALITSGGVYDGLATKEGTLTNEAGLYAALDDVTKFWEDGDSVTGAVGADEAYDATGWNGDTSVPEKDDIRDKIETMLNYVTNDAADTIAGALTINPGTLFIQEQADASADVAGQGQIWVNTATPNELWFTDDAGTDAAVATDATLCTDLEGTSLSITSGTLNAVGVNEAYTSGWNGDVGIPEKDDIYDYLHLMDSDDDGAVNNIDDDVIVKADLANEDWGDIVISGGVATLDTDTVSDNEIDYTNVTLGDFTINATAYDFGGVTSVELPNSAAPTTNATGEIALDTTIVDHQPLYQYYDGGENMTIIAFDTAQLPALDDEILKYDAASDKFVFEADATGGTGYWTDSGNYLEPTSGEYIVISGTNQSTFTEGLVINDAGGADADDDFRVETDTEDNFLWVDAGSNLMRVGDMDTNYIQTTAAGAMTFVGTGDIDLPNDSVDSGDINFNYATSASEGGAASTVATITGLPPDTATTQASQPNITALGTIGSLVATTADINAGTVDATIGGTTPAAGAFTTISASGLITATGGQIKFPATAVPSANANTLDDYEEGYHTATVTCSTSGNFTLNADTLAYTRVGRIVHVQGWLEITGENAPNGYLKVSMPFAGASLTEDAGECNSKVLIRNHGGTIVNSHHYMGAGYSYVNLYDISDAGVQSNITEAEVDTSFEIGINFTYIAN